MAFPYIFASLSGSVPGADLDANFRVCAFASDLTALTAVVATLPSSSTPLIPVAGGTAGSASTLSKADHQHPPQAATINLQTGTSYTLTTGDDGKVVELSNAGAIVLTVPNSLPVSFSCLITQAGAGQVTITAASGTTLRNANSASKTRAQWSIATLYVRANSGGAAAEAVLAGDLSA